MGEEGETGTEIVGWALEALFSLALVVNWLHLQNQPGPSGCDPEHVWTGGRNPSLGTLCSHVSLRA